ncbi:MAG: glycosyltransferase family 4 protein [Caldimonas sp.]
MTLPSLLILLLLGATGSWALTSSVRRYALHANLLDRPNERSSHTVPTPRGGGVAIVVSYLCLVVVFALREPAQARLATALLGGGGLVALLGFIDDRRHLPARWRFAGHLLASAWVIAWFGPVPPAPIFGPVVDLGPWAYFISALYIVWSINQFNFMDGIDGIASLEAIAVALGGAFVWWLTQPQGAWPLAVAFAACVAGFLVWNFPKARIFMGDAGSGFLGCVIATLALWCSSTLPHLFWSWIILGGAFMVDSTVTLVRRVALGERFNEAHRSHAYQYAARRHGSHTRVSVAFFALTVLWLLPLATLVAREHLDGAWGVVIAYTPLMFLALRYKAGHRAAQEV